MSLQLLVDPAPQACAGCDLFAGDLEYSIAIAGLGRATTLCQTLPDALVIELYAYEFLERAREFMGNGDADGKNAWRIPFWPACLLAAASITVHPWREIERMLPTFDQVVLVPRPDVVLVQEANRVLGALRFDPRAYDESARSLARRRKWKLQT